MKIAIIGLPLLALVGCDRADPPSERLEQAAEKVVEATVEQVTESSAPQGVEPSGPFAPRDECGDTPGAGGFLARLRSAVDSRNADDVLLLAADDVKLDFGGGAGSQELKARLQAQDSELWDALDEILALGCASDGEAGLTLPWYFAQETQLDPYSAYLVKGEGVVVRNAPAADAPQLARISWDMVEVPPTRREFDAFLPIRWHDETNGEDIEVEGFVAREHMRSLIDYRLTAARRNGRWRIVSLLAGD